MRFVDTNVLLYAVSRDPAEEHKAERANEILASRDLGLSVQVLQEFYVQATRQTRAHPLSHLQAATLVESFTRFAVLDIDVELVKVALEIRHRFTISYWDAAIIAAARALSCDVLLSEDLSHGQDYDGLQVRNPFGCGSAEVTGVQGRLGC